MIDYHIHTPLCNHAHGSMDEYIRYAIQKGLREICFLDHLILAGPGMKHSMTAQEVPLYVQSVARFRHQYRDRIVIRTGLEVDYIPEKRGEIDEILGMYAFDMIGGSYHFVNGINVASRKDPPKIGKHEEKKLVESYFEGLCRMLEKPWFDFICHPDIVKKTGITIPQSCDSIIDQVLTLAMEKQIAMEFNTGGWDHPIRDSYPSEDFVRKCRNKNIPFTIGSDAHEPERVGMYYDRAIGILSEAGYEAVLAFENRSGKPVPLKR